MSSGKRSAWRLFCGALLAGYALVLYHHTSFVAGGSDSSGYLNCARLLAAGRVSEPIQALRKLGLSPSDFARVFIPLGYTTGVRPGTMAPIYPPGLPLHMAAAGIIGGWERTPFLVSPIAALACLVLLYLLGLEFRLPPTLALGGSALLACSPTFLGMAVQSMSDVLATAWSLAAVLAAYRARTRRGALWAALAGGAFAFGILVRPTNVLLLVPLVVALPLRPKIWLSFAAGGLPLALWLLAYNAAAFGNLFTTGYGSILSGSMAWGHFPDRARHYGFWIARLLSPLLPLAWLAVCVDRRAPLRDRAVLLSWFGSFFLFYCFYEVYDDWWSTRFLLPGLPAVILGALVVARDLLFFGGRDRPARGAILAAVVLLAAALAVEARFITGKDVHKLYKGERIYPQACALARKRVPPNGIILSMQMSGALHYYTDLTFAMWNWLLPEQFALLRTSTESHGYRWYALLAPFEQEEVRKNLPGDWREIDRVRGVALWEVLPARPVGQRRSSSYSRRDPSGLRPSG
jgi:Dolichyl-phosphate-mannose-protein mannosyltransferase